MYPFRATNLLLFCGRAGVALIVLAYAVSFVVSLNSAGLIIGAVLLLLDIPLWLWAAANPLWVDIGAEGIRVRWLLSVRELPWSSVKVFWVSESNTARHNKIRHQFAHFRIGEGQWFKVRFSYSGICAFAEFVPETSQGKGMISHVELNG